MHSGVAFFVGEYMPDQQTTPNESKGSLTTAEVQFWRSEAKSCEERQKIELVGRNNYPFLINYYEGLEKMDAIHPHISTKQTMAIINEFFPNTNALISEVIFKNPDILLEALKPDAEEDLPIMKSALEYVWDKADGLVENRVALFDMLYAGYCAVEVDILPKVTERADVSVETPDEPQGIFEKIAKNLKKAMNPEEAEKNLAKLSPPMEANFATAQGTYIRRYDPMDVPLDWRAERIKDRRYNLKKVWMSKAEFDVKYPKFKEQVTAQEMRFEFSKHDMMMHNRKVLLFEFQIRMKGNKFQTIIISDSVATEPIDTFIRPYHTDSFNMKIGTLHKYGKLYPRSYAQINRKMNDEMNHYVRHMMDVAERNVPKYVTDKNKVIVDAKTALRSTKTNDLVEVDGNPINAVIPLQPTHVSLENKELLGIFRDQKNKLWSVSEPRISGQSEAKFATEIAIQESGFQAQNVDIQEGLRIVIQQQLGTAKDIIATFWDDEIFLKVTGHPKMNWYEPVTAPDPNDPNKSIVVNPLAELLTADYNVKIDIASAARKNRDTELQNMFFYMQQLVQIRNILNAQGKDINVEEIQRIAGEFGWNPEKLFIDFKSQEQLTVPTAGGETITPEEDATRAAEADTRLRGT